MNEDINIILNWIIRMEILIERAYLGSSPDLSPYGRKLRSGENE